MQSICRTCEFEFLGGSICPRCSSPLILTHPEMNQLNIAHIDCDAFFASVEKKRNPDLQDKPVIIGFGQRGVVSTACYVARIKGVKSAMPMFKALELCPDAVIIKPRIGAYAPISKQLKEMMLAITPSVNFTSIDEAYLDLNGTYESHKKTPVQSLVTLARQIENNLGLTVSIGLSLNRYLAKIASNLDKPKGFTLFGQREVEAILPTFPLSFVQGVGKVFLKSLNQKGFYTIEDIKGFNQSELENQLGSMGEYLWHVARGKNYQRTRKNRSIRSISNETTFSKNLNDLEKLEGHAWRLTVKVSDRAKTKNYLGKTVCLVVKQTNHKRITRQVTLIVPSNSSTIIFYRIQELLRDVLQHSPFRLIGVGLKDLIEDSQYNQSNSLIEDNYHKEIKAEAVSDLIRKKFGEKALFYGRSLK